ncbi:unnamed protein product [Heterosigma akashiwo]
MLQGSPSAKGGGKVDKKAEKKELEQQKKLEAQKEKLSGCSRSWTLHTLLPKRQKEPSSRRRGKQLPHGKQLRRKPQRGKLRPKRRLKRPKRLLWKS